MHTPGPWTKDKYGQLRSPSGEQVEVWDAGIAWVNRNQNAEANARLIAAAPDLYEALKDLLQLFDEVAPGYSQSTVAFAARTALSKLSQQQGSDTTGSGQEDRT